MELDIRTLVAQENSLRKTAGEKKKLVQELEEAEKKLREEQKTLQYFTEKEGRFSGFLALVKFVQFSLTSYNI